MEERVSTAKLRNEDYKFDYMNEHVNTGEGAWIIADLQVSARSPPYVHEAAQDQCPSWKNSDPRPEVKPEIKQTSTAMILVLKNKGISKENEREETDAMDLDT